MKYFLILTSAVLLGSSIHIFPANPTKVDTKKIVIVAGSRSHGSGEHEFKAGSLLLEKCLERISGVNAVVTTNGWPQDESIFDGASAVVIYADGGGGHPAIQGHRLETLGKLVSKGVGLACLHYAVEVPKDNGGMEFLWWIGGYFETFYSVNPTWEANFLQLPRHSITRGVKPFKLRDEWYYHMRFPEDMKGVTPILTALPPDGTRGKPGASSSHGGNPEVQKFMGQPEHVAWAFQRPDGGRGFGFTGGHFHKNWGDENFRKVVLNALLWVAKIEVPANGVECYLSPEDLQLNLDKKDEKKKAAATPAISVPKTETFVSPVTGGNK